MKLQSLWKRGFSAGLDYTTRLYCGPMNMQESACCIRLTHPRRKAHCAVQGSCMVSSHSLLQNANFFSHCNFFESQYHIRHFKYSYTAYCEKTVYQYFVQLQLFILFIFFYFTMPVMLQNTTVNYLYRKTYLAIKL